MYSAKILTDSINPYGNRLTTFEITYPRFVHSEFMTHRVFSRNSASSRAIPIKKMIERVESDPVMPVFYGKNQKGMQSEVELDEFEKMRAEIVWQGARDQAIAYVQTLDALGMHKQITNRLLEPWMWITVIVTANEWGNFFNLRCHKDAQPEIQKIATMMRDLYFDGETFTRIEKLYSGEWHAPLLNIDEEDRKLIDQLETEEQKKVSVGRCARVSYLTHDGKRDPAADIELCERLQQSGHWSPFEHVATPCDCFGSAVIPDKASCKYQSNISGWHQYRKMFRNENRRIYQP